MEKSLLKGSFLQKYIKQELHNKMSQMKQIDGYKIYMNKMIGKGSFGAVYEGVSDLNGEKVAVKILLKSSIDADEYLKNALFSEIKIMELIKSENVVGFYDVMESSKNYYLVQELCDGGDLSAIMKGGNSISEAQAKDYLLQICNGFLALVRQGIIHRLRDLKPANIMIRGNKLKIGDFGFAKKSETSSKVSNQTIVGTPLYMSLQILKSQPYSSKCDIWALGFIFYEMLHGYPPWNGKSEYDLINKIETRPLEINPNLSAETKDFLKKTLQKTQQKRLNWDQVFVHPIFNNYFMKISKGNVQFENKLKTIMANLRFQINSHNLDLCKILASLGYKNGQSQLDRDRFFRFLQMINPDINRNASDYIFMKTDYDKNGTISINQIEKIMNQNNINISMAQKKMPGFAKQDGTESFTMINPEIENKIKACFGKMMRQITSNNSTLRAVFNKFDVEKKGKMSYSGFSNMIKAVSKDIKEDEIKCAFDLVDQDGSQTVQFGELENYYVKVNGVPPALQNKNSSSSDQTRMEQQPNVYNNKNGQISYGQNGGNHMQNERGYQQQAQYQQQNHFTPNNPMAFLMGPIYSPPQMYQPQPYNPFLYNNSISPQQNHNNNKPGNGGIFDNFLLNQISNTNMAARGPYGW